MKCFEMCAPLYMDAIFHRLLLTFQTVISTCLLAIVVGVEVVSLLRCYQHHSERVTLAAIVATARLGNNEDNKVLFRDAGACEGKSYCNSDQMHLRLFIRVASSFSSRIFYPFNFVIYLYIQHNKH